MRNENVTSSGQYVKHRVLIRFVKLLDVVAVTAVFAFIWTKFYQNHVYGVPFYYWGNWAVILLYAESTGDFFCILAVSLN